MTIKDGYATLAELDVLKPRVIDSSEADRYKEVLAHFDWERVTGTLVWDDGTRWYSRSASPTHDHAVYERYDGN
jgi:hypothetical protein